MLGENDAVFDYGQSPRNGIMLKISIININNINNINQIKIILLIWLNFIYKHKLVNKYFKKMFFFTTMQMSSDPLFKIFNCNHTFC